MVTCTLRCNTWMYCLRSPSALTNTPYKIEILAFRALALDALGDTDESTRS